MRKPARPVLLVLLAVAQLVVGGSLLCCGAAGLIGVAAGTSSATVTVNVNGKPTTRVYDTREEMEREAPGESTAGPAMTIDAAFRLRPARAGRYTGRGNNPEARDDTRRRTAA